MQRKLLLDASEGSAAMRAMLDAASSESLRGIACAIVDDAGDVLNFGLLDGASPLARERAVAQAVAAARAQADVSDATGEGRVIREAQDDSVIGGLGVSGGQPAAQARLAAVGLGTIARCRAERPDGPSRPILGADLAARIVQAMLEEAIANRPQTTPPRRPAAVVVLDHHGDVLASACMAGANPAMARQNAFKKAYTAVCMRSDTDALEQHLRRLGRSVRDFPNPNFSGGPGGLVLRDPAEGAIIGGIGVSGRSGEEDQVVALAGLRAFDGTGAYAAYVSPDMRL